MTGCSSPVPTAVQPTPPPPAATPLPPSPTASLTPTHTPVPTTVPPTLTPTPIPNPMDIQAMRRVSYPGSDITIEEELAAGSNYHRYYASYLSEGLKIYALLTVPNGEPPAGGWPAIVFNHGYIPPRQYRTTERYIAYVDWLARSGYIVFRIDYRGNDRSEGTASGAYGSPGYTVDVLNAVASLERYPQANPQKIGMWGHSMGGFLTLRAMVISPDIKAGVIWSGVVGSYTDMFYNWRHPGPTPTPPPEGRGWRSAWVAQYGTPQENPAFWDSISANAFLSDLSGPLQLDYGTADEEVPPAFSETLAQEIQAAGGTVEIYSYPGDDHNLSHYFSAAMTHTIEFYDRYLK
ncbi:MAG: alpha/beta fold hydrolase [Chloroflexi bacterium]|nr:alpha/beta fold hydrolase [Chloroflexota bacterium]